ncbi:MBL fold metallo-hydrolase [Patescibacteria group bacterium]|nr:MBL fold metallo-hydrolase [Patescibacteria group bacterium]
MKIKFLGAAGTVTGSCYWLQGDNGGLVVDMGMFQGLNSRKLNMKTPEIDVEKLNGVVVTHAHLDHGGRLPLLIKMGYKGKVYMTAATRDLLELSLHDTVKISQEYNKDSLFGEEEVEQLLSQVELLEIGEEKILGEFKVRFLRAGHILGAVSVMVEAKGKSVVFSGDVGTGESPLILPPEPPEKADVVILESTYGDRLHEDEDEEKILREEIEKVSRNKGVLLIPVFSIQRSQRILHLLDHIQRQGGLPGGMKVYFDSPMAIEATKIFGKYRQYYSRELADQAKKDDPFNFPGLVVTRQAWEKKIIRKDKKAKIIVAGSGMMSGGRIMGHAKEYLPKPSTRLLIVGYQAKGTLGREIVDGERRVSIDGVRVEVNAKMRQIYSMSAHADQEQLLKWLSKIKGVKKVILTHGEDEPRRVLGEKVKTRFGLEVDKPILGEEIEYL